MKRAAEATVTSVGKGPGTYPYMAPEMFRKGHRSRAVDIYALGCLFLELFGKRRVWPGLDGPDIMMKVLGSYGTPPEMPDTSHLESCYQSLCQKLCQLDAKNRPCSAEVIEMLSLL